jgi:uncharacterized protein
MLPDYPQSESPLDILEESLQTEESKVEKTGKERRGFASMDPSKQKEIASKGGRAAHAKGTAHEFTSDEARLAGSKGGKSVSQNREHMAEIGRKGGQARGSRTHS